MKVEKDTIVLDAINKLETFCLEHQDFNFDIYPYEWESFCEVMYEFVAAKNLLEGYHKMLWEVVFVAVNDRAFFNKTRQYLQIVKNDIPTGRKYGTHRYITINSLLESLYFLCHYGIRKADLMDVAERIREQCELGQIIEIKEYVKR